MQRHLARDSFRSVLLVAVMTTLASVVPPDGPSVFGTSAGGIQPVASQPAWILPAAPGWCRRDPAGPPAPPARPNGRPASYLHTCGSHIYDSRGQEVRIAGVSWSGMEHGDRAPSGLATRNWQAILEQVAALGYNTIRLPLSDDAIELDRAVGAVDYGVNPDLQGLSGLGVLDRLVRGAGDRGLKVILDRHYVYSGSLTQW